jgi:hypothetical protein
LPVATGTQLKKQLPHKVNGFGYDFASANQINSATAPAGARTSLLFEIAFALVRFDHVARFIVNAHHSIM